jgi:hypothetical protein
VDWYPLERGEQRRRSGPWVVLGAAVVVAAAIPIALALRDAPTAPAATPPSRVTAPAAVADAAEAGRVREPAASPADDIAQIAGQVADVRELELRHPVDATFLPIADLIARLNELTRGHEGANAPLESRVRLLSALRMLPAEADVATLLQIAYDESLAGLYVPAEQRLYVVDEPSDEASPRTRWNSAHEIVHALQDQSFDLTPLLEHQPGAVDAELAALAVLEGDAVVTQEVWSRRFQTELERSRLGDGLARGGLIPLPGHLPRFLSAQFAFPYEAGADFVVALIEHGGYEAVDAALRDPPRTTAEILHPQRYLAGVSPVVVLPPREPGGEWEAARTDEMGEFHLRQMLDQVGSAAAHTVAAGWVGGSVSSWHRGEETAVAVTIVYDAEESAAALCEILPRWWELASGALPAPDGTVGGPHGAMAASCTGAQVRFGVAPDAATALLLSS